MRSLAFTALLGSLVASGLVAQSLTEHAAAAAGATIGTAAGKPLGTALGKVFGDVDKSTSNATTSKTAKPAVVKPAPVSPPEATAHAPAAPLPSVGGGDGVQGAGGGGSSHRSARRKERVVEADSVPPAPITPVAAPVAVAVVKEPTVEDVASIKVGTTSSELRAALGAPESRVSIPGDGGHLLEICQYWAKGEPLGTIRLDNGHVVSVQTSN